MNDEDISLNDFASRLYEEFRNGLVNEENLKEIKERIKDSYNNGDRIEKTIGNIFDDKNYGYFAKIKYGNYLGDIVAKEIKNGEKCKVFPFENVFYNRFYTIAEAFLKKKIKFV